MTFIPFIAKKFGGLSTNIFPVSFNKARVSGSTNMSYILHSKAGCMPGQSNIFSPSSLQYPEGGDPIKENKITRAFKRDSCKMLRIPIGPRNFKECPHSFTYEEFYPHDDETLGIAIEASYKQIYGNLHAMESERPKDLERRLRNGDITIREFIRGLAKSPFYRSNYFEVVNQLRFIELSFKHILGRPPHSQSEIIFHIELIHNEGLDSHIDSLIDSAEYQEIFGSSIVPYSRCWNSPCGIKSFSFILSAALARGFAVSDNSIHKRQTIANTPGGTSQLINLYSGTEEPKIKVSKHFLTGSK